MRPSVQEMIARSNGKKNKKVIEKIMPVLLFLIASVSVLTSVGIVVTLIVETITFFTRVPFFDFIFGTTWLPFSNKDAQFGILPLIVGTLKVTLIATVV
ncbi:MAG: phosphate ABC transporter permease subunit PstC, partial [Planococcus donghaensis]